MEVLSFISTISNQPVAGSIIVRHHKVKAFLYFLLSVYGPMRSTHRVSQGSASACFSDKNPYFFVYLFVIWHVEHVPHCFCTSFLRFLKVKCCQIDSSVWFIPGWHNTLWYHFTICFCNFFGTTILLSLQYNSIGLLSPPWKDCLTYLSLFFWISSSVAWYLAINW